MVASYNPEVTGSEVMAGMARLAQKMIDFDADPNLQDASGRYDRYMKIWSLRMLQVYIYTCI